MCEIPEDTHFMLKRREYESLTEKQNILDKELSDWQRKSTPTYEMNLLHKYNEIKDVTQILLGAIANIEGVTVREIHQRFDLPTDN